MKELERQLKALANRRRLTMIKLLKHNREMSVGDIAKEIKLSFKATSKHLMILDRADLVEKEQRGLSVYYCLSSQQNLLFKSLLSIL